MQNKKSFWKSAVSSRIYSKAWFPYNRKESQSRSQSQSVAVSRKELQLLWFETVVSMWSQKIANFNFISF